MIENAADAGLLSTLGINWKLFLAQLINFGILLFVLAKWVYKPLMKTVDDRSKKIAQGLSNAEEAKKQLAHAQANAEAFVQKAEQEARTILEDARLRATKEQQDINAKTKEDLERQLADARERLKMEKEAALQAVKNEVATLVIQVTQKVLGASLETNGQKQLIDQAIKDIQEKR